MKNIILQLNNITKIFPHPEKPVLANDGVCLDLRKGEVLALVGENGTGKSTLMNILYGLLEPDAGEIILNDEKVIFKNPRDAIAHGIGMVHQHFMLIPSFTVAENLVFTFEPKKGIFVDKRKAEEIALDISEKYGLEIDPGKKVAECSLSMQQRVEILKILYHGADILIFDEPTAVLTPRESEELFKAFEALKNMGKSIIFITHKLREVCKVADRATVMRKGKIINTISISETNMEELAVMMIGRRVDVTGRKMSLEAKDTKEEILKVDRLTTGYNLAGMSLKDISFTVRPGEIIGIAGVGGNGQELIVEALTGLFKDFTAGDIFYKGENVNEWNSCQIREIGIAHITGERYMRGICAGSDIYESVMMGFHKRPDYSSKVFMKKPALTKLVQNLMEKFDIKADSPGTPILNLSGGNIQKCILARELTLSKELIIAEEPTRGVDIGSIEFIHSQLVEKAKEGYGIVLVSTDLDEILALSTKILVMSEGKIVGVVDPKEKDIEKKIGLYMAGITLVKEGGVQ